MIKSRLSKGLLLVFCCWHASFLIASIFPGTTARDEPGPPMLDLYSVLFAGRQQWNMFDNIPTLHAMDLRVEGENKDGERITLGCVLPGFEPYPQPEDPRYFVAFYRLLSLEPYRDAYLQTLADRLPSYEPARGGRNWVLVADAHYTRHLYHVRRDGNLSMPATKAFDLPGPGAGSP